MNKIECNEEQCHKWSIGQFKGSVNFNSIRKLACCLFFSDNWLLKLTSQALSQTDTAQPGVNCGPALDFYSVALVLSSDVTHWYHHCDPEQISSCIHYTPNSNHLSFVFHIVIHTAWGRISTLYCHRICVYCEQLPCLCCVTVIKSSDSLRAEVFVVGMIVTEEEKEIRYDW